MTPGRCTLYTSTKPAQLGKTFSLRSDGSLEKVTAGDMWQGTFITPTFANAAEFAALLKSVRTDQALSASTPISGATEGTVTTAKQEASTPGAMARTKRNLHFLAGPGFGCLDADAPKTGAPLTIPELWSQLCKVCPAAAQASVIAYPSGSSEIFEGDKQRRGITGVHLYALVLDVSDTERFGKTLSKRLWLAGHGRIEVSSSGALLPRTTFDEAVHQPARLLFSGGAVTVPPLEQRRGDPMILAGADLTGDAVWLDTRAAMPDLTSDEEARYVGLLESAKEGLHNSGSSPLAAARSGSEYLNHEAS